MNIGWYISLFQEKKPFSSGVVIQSCIFLKFSCTSVFFFSLILGPCPWFLDYLQRITFVFVRDAIKHTAALTAAKNEVCIGLLDFGMDQSIFWGSYFLKTELFQTGRLIKKVITKTCLDIYFSGITHIYLILGFFSQLQI